LRDPAFFRVAAASSNNDFNALEASSAITVKVANVVLEGVPGCSLSSYHWHIGKNRHQV
jgi:hypothetical protein